VNTLPAQLSEAFGLQVSLLLFAVASWYYLWVNWGHLEISIRESE
jgi:hypothetical protein